MASKAFTFAPPGSTLEGFRAALATAAERLNERRVRQGSAAYAPVRVSEVLIDPRDGSRAFYAYFSDHDARAPKAIIKAEQRLRRSLLRSRFCLKEASLTPWFGLGYRPV